MPVTLRFQSTGTVPGSGQPITMVGSSMTIGRGDENDLVLPDPEKLISKRHCVIEDQGGNVVIIDISTNGTFLNYGKAALGRVPTPLNDGDILTLGSYELLVDIRSGRPVDPLANIAAPLEDAPVSHGRAGAGADIGSLLDDPAGKGDFLDDLLGSSSSPGGPSRVKRDQLGDDGLLPPLGDDDLGLMAPAPDPNAGQGASRSSHSPSVEDHFAPPRTSSVIPDDWDDDFLSPSPSQSQPPAAPFGEAVDDDLGAPAFIPEDAMSDLPGAPAQTPPPSAARQAAPAPSPPAAPTPAAPPPVERPQAAGDAAARAFLKSVGAEELNIADAELVPTMSRLGHVLRIMVHGLREILMTRTSIKSEFRINQTMISAGGNNPLKFSISPEQAVEALVKPSTKGYLDATEAAEQALKDIKAHEIAMMTGMEAALKGILKRMSPDALAGQIETNGGIGSVLKGKKARYWEVYEKLYAEISDQAENDFHELFSKEFARAYQDQLERLK